MKLLAIVLYLEGRLDFEGRLGVFGCPKASPQVLTVLPLPVAHTQSLPPLPLKPQ